MADQFPTKQQFYDATPDLRTVSAVSNSRDPDTGAEIDTWVTRRGDLTDTLKGRLNKLGLVVIGDTATGCALNNVNEVVLNNTAGSADFGGWYSWGGSFLTSGHTVPPGTDPALPGSGYVARSSLLTAAQAREALRRSYEEAGYTVVGTFQAGFTYVNANDIGLDEFTGKGYTGPAGTVAAGTDPSSGGFTDRSGYLLSSHMSEVINVDKVPRFGDTSGIPTLEVPDDPLKRLLIDKTCTSPNDFGVLQINRAANYSGGTVGYVGSAVRAQTNVSPNANGSFEWTALFVMDNNAVNNPAGGGPGSGASPQNVAMYGQAFKRNTSATWAGCLEIQDVQAPANGVAVGLEITCVADGADSTIPQRVGSHVTLLDRLPGGQNVEWGRAYWADAVSAGVRFRTGYEYTGAIGDAVFRAEATTGTDAVLMRDKSTLAVGLDFTQATYTTGRALHLKAGQKIALSEDGSQTITGSAAGPVVVGRFNMSNSFAIPSTNVTTSALTGTSGAPPSQVAGYITVLIDGAPKKIAFYNA